MIHIDFDPSALSAEQKTWWDGWQAKAAEATQGLIQKWEATGRLSKDDFKDAIWRDLKQWLLENVFHGKCAYCETHIRESRQSGHAEHFRPKGGVNYKELDGERSEKAMIADASGQAIEHPGYFWLAYHWRNIFPSCELCNCGGGKRNQFPVQRQHVLAQRLTRQEMDRLHKKPLLSPAQQDICYLQPDDLDDLERPLLLHPYIDNPREHICFGYAGIEAPREDENGGLSAKGVYSIDVYDLKNDNLRRARQRAQSDAWTKFWIGHINAEKSGCSPEECLQQAWDAIREVQEGTTPYSSAALDYVYLHCQMLGGG